MLLFRRPREEPCAELSGRGQMSDIGHGDAEGSGKRWLPGHSPAETCKDRGRRDRFRSVSGERLGHRPEKKGGPRPEDTVEEGRLRMAVAALGPPSGYFILVNPQQWEGVRYCSAGRSAKERAGCLEPR